MIIIEIAYALCVNGLASKFHFLSPTPRARLTIKMKGQVPYRVICDTGSLSRDFIHLYNDGGRYICYVYIVSKAISIHPTLPSTNSVIHCTYQVISVVAESMFASIILLHLCRTKDQHPVPL